MRLLSGRQAHGLALVRDRLLPLATLQNGRGLRRTAASWAAWLSGVIVIVPVVAHTPTRLALFQRSVAQQYARTRIAADAGAAVSFTLGVVLIGLAVSRGYGLSFIA